MEIKPASELEADKRVCGFVTNLQQLVSAKGKDFYTFEIGDMKFSRFGKAEIKDGQFVDFAYEEKVWNDTVYLNPVHFYQIGETHEEPSKKEVSFAQDQLKEKFPPADIFPNDKQNRRATMMKCAVELCTRRNILSDMEIQAQYRRLMTVIGEEILTPEENKTLGEKIIKLIDDQMAEIDAVNQNVTLKKLALGQLTILKEKVSTL